MNDIYSFTLSDLSLRHILLRQWLVVCRFSSPDRSRNCACRVTHITSFDRWSEPCSISANLFAPWAVSCFSPLLPGLSPCRRSSQQHPSSLPSEPPETPMLSHRTSRAPCQGGRCHPSWRGSPSCPLWVRATRTPSPTRSATSTMTARSAEARSRRTWASPRGRT